MARDILIVDDEEDIRELIAGILEDEGYEPRQASDADGALNEIVATFSAANERRPICFLFARLEGDIWRGRKGSRMKRTTKGFSSLAQRTTRAVGE